MRVFRPEPDEDAFAWFFADGSFHVGDSPLPRRRMMAIWTAGFAVVDGVRIASFVDPFGTDETFDFDRAEDAIGGPIVHVRFERHEPGAFVSMRGLPDVTLGLVAAAEAAYSTGDYAFEKYAFKLEDGCVHEVEVDFDPLWKITVL